MHGMESDIRRKGTPLGVCPNFMRQSLAVQDPNDYQAENHEAKVVDQFVTIHFQTPMAYMALTTAPAILMTEEMATLLGVLGLRGSPIMAMLRMMPSTYDPDNAHR